MAFVDGDYAAAIDHRPPCLWKSLAASRWPPLDLQKIQRVTVPAIRVPAATGHLFLLWNCIFNWRPRLANATLWGTGAINLERCTARPIPRGRFSLHEPILRSRGGGFFAGYPINQGIAMKSQRSTPAKIARKQSAILASRYLDLQRLRDEVRKAETRGAPRRCAEGSEGQGRRPSEKAISVSE
jgi:hypothetical protein